MNFEPVLMKYVDNSESHKIDFYMSHGGYEVAKTIFDKKPEEVTEIVKQSGLRGRGGAGFPTGVKWGFVPKDKKPVYLAINADEGEPGTFKDKVLLYDEPHLLLEGIIITCWAIGSNTAFIYIRGEFSDGVEILERAIKEAEEKNFLGKNIFGRGYDVDVTVVRGAGAYICGEETALLTSLEGGRGNPKIKPPFPAVSGLWMKPTIINNVETICAVPSIVANGSDWHRQWGTEKSPGFKMFSIAGDVNHPCVIEVPLGTNLKDIIYDYCKGIPGNRRVKAVIPGGSSTPFLSGEEIDVPMTYEDLMDKGSMLGSGAITVLDETRDMVEVALNVAKFYAHESCGQCTPCREGTGWLAKIIDHIYKGKGREEDLDLIIEVGNKMIGNTICVLADAAAMPLESIVTKFKSEFIKYIQKNTSVA